MELRRHAAGLGTERNGGMVAYCMRADMEAQRYGALELWKCAAGKQTWRCSELWRNAVGLGTWRCRGTEVRRCVAGLGT